MMAKNTKVVLGFLVALSCAMLSIPAARAQVPTRNSQAGHTFALVIGISKYLRLPRGSQLQFAQRDATLFADSLRKAGVSSERIKLLVGPRATATSIKAALGNWLARNSSPSDTVYIFFSGNGLVETGFNESYLLGYDSDPNEPYTSAVSLADITRVVSQRIKAGKVLILADAVRRELFNPEADAGTRTKLFNQAFGEIVGSRAGVSAVLASSPSEVSQEAERWGGAGIFAKCAIDVFSGAGDHNTDGVVTGDEFFDFVSSRVASETSNKQHAWLAGNNLAQITLPGTSTQPSAVAVESARYGKNRIEPEEGRTPTTRTRRGRKQQGRSSSAEQSENGAAATSGAEPGISIATSSDIARASSPARPNRSRPANSPKPEVGNNPSAVGNDAADERLVVTSPPNRAVRGRASRTTRGAATTPSRGTPSGKNETATPARRGSPAASREPRRIVPPPDTKEVNAVVIAYAAPVKTGIEVAPLPPARRPLIFLPSISRVLPRIIRTESEAVTGSLAVAEAGAAPSPYILLTRAAILSGALIEPRNTNAWDYYQTLVKDPTSMAEVHRLTPMLSAALTKAGTALVTGDVRSDNISEKVDAFRRAGLMLARGRSLTAENTASAVLEKLSAAQALVALQFYDEAHKVLAQLTAARLAPVENTLGLAYVGGLNEYQAERAFQRAIELDPKWATPHYNLAMLYRGQKKDPMPELELAATIDPSHLATLIALGDEQFAKEKWTGAAEAYRNALKVKPTDETLHTKLGHTLYSQGLRDEANKEYQRARELRAQK